MQSELIISTYQKPAYLALVLQTLAGQDRMPDRVCIADDGSDQRTAAVIERFRAAHPALPLRHVWHEDQGFRKTLILNTSVASSTADYLIFIDDDCAMHPGFIARHLTLAEQERFVTGSVIRLSEAMTATLLAAERIGWTDGGRPEGWAPRGLSEWLKSMPLPAGVMGWLDRLSPVKCNWAGGNSSTFRAHILAVNGFDTRMEYGGEDKEFGARLTNAGIRGRHLRYSAPLYHLEHPRGYVDAEVKRRNREIIEATRATGKVWTDSGIAG